MYVSNSHTHTRTRTPTRTPTRTHAQTQTHANTHTNTNTHTPGRARCRRRYRRRASSPPRALLKNMDSSAPHSSAQSPWESASQSPAESINICQKSNSNSQPSTAPTLTPKAHSPCPSQSGQVCRRQIWAASGSVEHQ